ncbi:hypothetical protein P148_SR1C00001G0899 [candidate division SR1 bacterium RAAC1_SR1_1]|nr:hypothetical protein P148_SR1C00001G0899 [candidate division SR1 bacterium RAAC1_SR1_1]
MKKLFIITASFGMLFLMGCQKVTIIPDESLTGNIQEITGSVEETTGFIIQSFEDCLNSGFPIMESYPRQCNDGKTTYVEEIVQELTGENTNVDNTTGQQIGETGTKQEDSTGTNLSILQQKLRAMMERRNQQTQSGTTTNSGTTSTTIQTTTVSDNEQVTEDDIENLENIIDTIIKK